MSQRRQNMWRGGILIAGILLVAIGISMGDVHAVLQKAIRICFECIGLG